jgi:hypothetical protein
MVLAHPWTGWFLRSQAFLSQPAQADRGKLRSLDQPRLLRSGYAMMLTGARDFTRITFRPSRLPL